MKRILLIFISAILGILIIQAKNTKLFSLSKEQFCEKSRVTYEFLSKQPGTIDIKKICLNHSVINDIPEYIELPIEDENILLQHKMVLNRTTENYKYLSYSNAESFIYISILEDDIIADIVSSKGTYNIVTCSKNEYALVKVDSESTESEPIELTNDNAGSLHNFYDSQTEYKHQSSRSNSIPYIRILVLYTDSAAKLISPILSSTQIKNKIYKDIMKSNESFRNSDIDTAFELVYIGRTTGTERGRSFNQILDDFIDRTDNYINEVHTLRDKYAADICVLLINDTTYCGLSYVGVDKNHAFSVVKGSTGCSNKFSFVHEIGHLIGCQHDKYEHPGNYPFKKGHGYVHYVPGDTASSWRTIMAYNCACDSNDTKCKRILYWSNPEKYYYGVAMGDNTYANNAYVWNNRAEEVSLFRTITDNKTLTSSDNNTALFQNIRVTQSITTQNGYQVESGQTVELTGRTFIRLRPNTHIKAGSTFHASINHDADTTYHHYMSMPKMRDEDIETASLNNENIFKLSPNPATDILKISSTELISHNTIYTLTGQPVLQTTDTEISVSAFPAGMYIVRAITTTGEQLQSKFIKQ